MTRDLLKRELLADGIIHALGLTLAIGGVVALVVVALLGPNPVPWLVLFIYATGLLAMLGCSAAYHLLRRSRWRDLLQRLDHAAIFAMIAGSYTPFTTMRLDVGWAASLTASIWSAASAGMVVKLFRPRHIARISTVLYLILGWIGLVALGPFLEAFDGATLILLVTGGALYSVGVVFHIWKSLPYQNAIWHGFVLAGASVHYVAVLNQTIV